MNGDGTGLPFPDDTFDRIICSEVHRAHPRRPRPRSPSSTGCSSRAGRSPSPSRPGSPRRSAGRYPTSTTRRSCAGGHVRIFTEAELRRTLRDGGLQPGAAHHAHALHSPVLVAEVRGRADQRRPPARPGLPPAARVGHRQGAAGSPAGPSRLLNPVLGKSLVVYAHKPVGRRRSGRCADAQSRRRRRRPQLRDRAGGDRRRHRRVAAARRA